MIRNEKPVKREKRGKSLTNEPPKPEINLTKYIEEAKNEEAKNEFSNKIALWALIISIITLFAGVFPLQSWITNFVLFYLQPTQYTIPITDGGTFNPLIINISTDRFINVEQSISYNAGDKATFSHSIVNTGENSLDQYNDIIVIVDPLNQVRGNLVLLLNKPDENFKTIFSLPPSNEKLYGEWNIYSFIYENNATYSVIKMPFTVKEPELWYYKWIPIIIFIPAFIILIFSIKRMGII